MRRFIFVVALIPAALAFAAPPAVGAGVNAFTIHETIDFENEVFTFTASDALCPSGTFEDEVTNARAFQSETRVNLTIETVYTCDDGSGEFYAVKHVNILFFDNFNTNSGPVKLVGGTGAYEGLAGHGDDVGRDDGETGIATGDISGFLVHP